MQTAMPQEWQYFWNMWTCSLHSYSPPNWYSKRSKFVQFFCRSGRTYCCIFTCWRWHCQWQVSSSSHLILTFACPHSWAYSHVPLLPTGTYLSCCSAYVCTTQSELAKALMRLELAMQSEPVLISLPFLLSWYCRKQHVVLRFATGRAQTCHPSD